VKWTRKKETVKGEPEKKMKMGPHQQISWFWCKESLRNFFDRLISQKELQRKEDFVDFLSREWQTENTIGHYLVFSI